MTTVGDSVMIIPTKNRRTMGDSVMVSTTQETTSATSPQGVVAGGFVNPQQVG